ncbi:MAG: hypothetical protein J0I41_16795 [Filimonas sp.]|nr:hypothetical protein [Filimonas sp.]
MNRVLLLLAGILLASAGFAQTDTTKQDGVDTVKVGNFIIIRKNKDKDKSVSEPNTKKYVFNVEIEDGYRRRRNNTNVTTNWLILDLGFANWRDETDYSSPEVMNSAYLHRAPTDAPYTKNDFALRNVKSSNVNIWLFMQKLNIVNHQFNLKYGLGYEMYNFRYETNISYHKNPAYIWRDTLSFSKNKLFAGYATIPLMLNYTPNPGRRHGFTVSAGMSAGYLLGSRNKQISGERGKEKIKGNIGLDDWRIAYVAEIGFGPIKLYGSYSVNPLHEQTLKQYPFAFGIRFSN